ncbi:MULTISPECIES: DASS family sodium-coupled anion symporter [Halobacterium]|uniref:DASS family transport protein n=2 Tax=Halobacterium salinarum TaxID=2242 RepID=B0R9Z7_HALS3|nr:MULTISPECIES: DASS family sodium-coupled anion symporter [Halobacterium]MBB6090518.1 sodium-dependent dicarboxylate transporter 2/3/5 [Halobacterium salinarum]MDL0137926.1 DASS family sodium-coupled anion symporter [Halobacterium salinarum]MDL0141673.1 DASS family sodium-coupled anion symporter [Halobacterium salinarum]QRY21499.1 DASS family sodium-coupled anion symporter [Halobacterium sp. GSL-19]QRY26097.1 DASS family sodium-coupled anion symporter [Halobacterium sp. BOL4-2]
MIRRHLNDAQQRLVTFCIATLGALLIALAPSPTGLSLAGQYSLATMFFAGTMWVTGAFPLAVTALTIPILLTGTGVYDDIDTALVGFSDHLIFLFMAGFMLANAVQKYGIDRRIALYTMAKMGSSPRRLIGAVMVSTAVLSMWVSNTATTAMMTPIAVGVLSQVLSDDAVASAGEAASETAPEQAADSAAAGPADEFTNMQIGMMLGTAYAASIGGVGTIIGTPPNAVLVGQLNAALNYEIGFVDWLLIGLPVVLITLPLVWYVLTFVLYPPQIDDVDEAQRQAQLYLEDEDALTTRGRRVAVVFTGTAGLWILGGLGSFLQSYLPSIWTTTLFGGSGMTVFGLEGHQGLLYYVLVGVTAIPALVLADTMEWDELVDIDWGTLLLFGGGITLARALADTGTTEWLATTIFGGLTGMPIVLIIAVVVLVVVFLTEMTSNTATTSILVPILIGLGSVFAATLGLTEFKTAIFLSVAGTIAASFAFALPVATPPNAIVFGSGYIKQRHMLRTGVVLNVIMTVVLTGLIWLLFKFVWPHLLW